MNKETILQELLAVVEPYYVHSDQMQAIAAYIESRLVTKGGTVNGKVMKAMQGLMDDYKELADSGDAGNWRAEDQEAYKDCVKVIGSTAGTGSIKIPSVSERWKAAGVDYNRQKEYNAAYDRKRGFVEGVKWCGKWMKENNNDYPFEL